jgi:hypothetical protein
MSAFANIVEECLNFNFGIQIFPHSVQIFQETPVKVALTGLLSRSGASGCCFRADQRPCAPRQGGLGPGRRGPERHVAGAREWAAWPCPGPGRRPCLVRYASSTSVGPPYPRRVGRLGCRARPDSPCPRHLPVATKAGNARPCPSAI